MKLRKTAILLIAALSALAAHAAPPSFVKDGFNISAAELSTLLDFERDVRFASEEEVKSLWSDKLDSIAVFDIKQSANRYAYAYDPATEHQIIAIRGTSNLKNALLDLEFWRRISPLLGIRLHKGFETAALLVLQDIEPRLKKDLPILICGHSLGAAEAIILGMMLSISGYKVDRILASGPPKVTDAAGWKLFSALPVIRVADAYDPVPLLPPDSLYPDSPLIQGGPLLLLLDGAYYTVADSAYYDSPKAAFQDAGKYQEHFDVADHMVPAYCERAAQKVKGIEFVPFDRWEEYAKPLSKATQSN